MQKSPSVLSAARSLLRAGYGLAVGGDEDSEARTAFASLPAGSFVTLYADATEPYSGDDVWCCMSNGQYDSSTDAWHNVIESAGICRGDDPRRTTFEPQAVEVTLLSPKPWRLIRDYARELSRDRHRAISVTVDGRRSAIYLPSVWNEHREWSASELRRQLVLKALRLREGTPEARAALATAQVQVYEIDAVDFGPLSVAELSRDTVEVPISGAEVSQFGRRVLTHVLASALLQRASGFYARYASPEGVLAYSVARGQPQYRSGSLVRSWADLGTFVRMARALGLGRLAPAEGQKPLTLDEWIDANARAMATASQASRLPLTSPSDAPQEAVAELGCWQDVGSRETRQAELARTVLRDRSTESPDASFLAPQAALVLARSALLHPSPDSLGAIKEAWSRYAAGALGGGARGTRDACETNHGFASNWISQALASGVTARLVESARVGGSGAADILGGTGRDAVRRSTSVTETACAWDGLLALFGPGVAEDETGERMLERTLLEWERLQSHWGTGGFRYRASDGDEYRTDVTSHVVSVLLRLTEIS